MSWCALAAGIAFRWEWGWGAAHLLVAHCRSDRPTTLFKLAPCLFQMLNRSWPTEGVGLPQLRLEKKGSQCEITVQAATRSHPCSSKGEYCQIDFLPRAPGSTKLRSRTDVVYKGRLKQKSLKNIIVKKGMTVRSCQLISNQRAAIARSDVRVV